MKFGKSLIRAFLPSLFLLLAGIGQAVGAALPFTLSWTDTANNEIGFTIERTQPAKGLVDFIPVAANPQGGQTVYVDTALIAGTEYCYRVKAFNTVGESAYSNSVCKTALADTDTDGLTDDEEVALHGTDPINPDTDGDGLLDGAEVNLHGTDPINPDTDGDSITDGVEVEQGTDPLAASNPRVLENPQPGSFQSGIGVISGFVCSATLVEMTFDGGPPFAAAYGTNRVDTQGECGDTNNGFSLLFNWNLLGDGVHTVAAFADGVEFASVTLTVTTLGLGEFPTGLSGEFSLPDFPQTGTDTRIRWQQSLQNFVIISGNESGGGNAGSGSQVLENPQPGSFQSGIGVISGFVCSAALVEMTFDGGPPFAAAYGTNRVDTQGECGDTNNGFSLLFNWNLLGDGVHTVAAFADGVEFASVMITVTTLGLGEFPTGLSGEFSLPDFPQTGTDTSIRWQQSLQNFVIISGRRL